MPDKSMAEQAEEIERRNPPKPLRPNPDKPTEPGAVYRRFVAPHPEPIHTLPAALRKGKK